MRRTGTVTLLLVLSLALSMGLSGCFLFGDKKGEEQGEEPAAGQAEDPRRTVGDAADPAYAVSLVNGTEVAIETLAMRPVGTLEYTGDLLAGMPISINEEVVLRVAEAGAAQAYDLKATAEGGAITYEFVGVPVTSITQAFLHVADGQPYVDYVSLDGVVSSTKDYLVAQEPSVVVEEETATSFLDETEADDTSQAVTVAQSSYVDTGDYDSADGYTYEAPASAGYEDDATYAGVPMEAPAASEQTTDSCIDDVMLK